MPKVLTAEFLKALKPKPERFEISDANVPGLRMRVSPDGSKVWSYWYRPKPSVRGGHGRRFLLGAYSEAGDKGLSLLGAREEARQVAARVGRKEDPQAERWAKRAADLKRKHAPKETTVSDLVLASLKTLPLRPATRKEWTRRVDVEILTAPFAKKAAAALTTDEVETWLSGIAERSGHSANSTRTVLLRCYSWAVEKKRLRDGDGAKITVSPIANVPKPDAEADDKESERVLSPEELRAVLLALDEMEGEAVESRDAYEAEAGGVKLAAVPKVRRHEIEARLAYVDATRLLVLSGVRRSAVLGLKRSEVEGLDSKEPLWTVPGERAKNGKAHKVPLSREAVQLLERRFAAAKAMRTESLFPQYRTAGEALDKPMTWSSRFVADLKARAARIHGRKMEPWKVHGFRSALATHGRGKLKISGDVISLLLSHTPPGPKVTRNYQRAELLDERRAALAAWADWLEQLRTGKTQSAKVLSFKHPAS